MVSRDRAGEHRDRWITTICTGIINSVDAHPALDPAELDPGLGEASLVRALLITRITALAAEGCSKDDIVGGLAGSGVFVATGPQRGHLADLVNKVQQGLRHNWITGRVWLMGCGLRDWSPEGTYRLLLEVWSARRLSSVPRSRVRKELARCWGVRDRSWLDYCVSRPPEPLADYSDFLATREAEPNTKAATIAAFAFSKGITAGGAWERWVDHIPFGLAAEHLSMVGGDLIAASTAEQSLRPPYDSPDSDLRRAEARALEIIQQQLEQLRAVADGLSTLERELFRERTAQERFQDRCLAALVNWSCNAWGGPSLCSSKPAHGMWGPLPWWVIVVRDGDQERAALGAVEEGTLPLGFELVLGKPNHLDLICRKPWTSSPGLHARFRFDLANPVHASELLLIGCRGSVCIDLVKEPDYEQDDPEPVQLGTLRVMACDELRQALVEIASRALIELLPGVWMEDDDSFERLSRGTSPWQVEGYEFDSWLTPRSLLIAESDSAAGEVSLEAKVPPTSISFVSQTGLSATRSPLNIAQHSLRERHKNGFVYIQRNPAFPHMLKIGYTQQLSEDRAAEISRTSVPFPFEVVYRILTSHAREGGTSSAPNCLLHRVAPNREFFAVNQETAEEAIRYCPGIGYRNKRVGADAGGASATGR